MELQVQVKNFNNQVATVGDIKQQFGILHDACQVKLKIGNQLVDIKEIKRLTQSAKPGESGEPVIYTFVADDFVLQSN